MVEGDRVRAWGARVLAPVAFLAAATALVLLVQRSLESEETGPGPTQATPTVAVTEVTKGTEPATTGPERKIYSVKEGDTLESIAARFDTTVADLLDLNPEIDPLALRPGQKIRVR